jgi:hypothetical protein
MRKGHLAARLELAFQQMGFDDFLGLGLGHGRLPDLDLMDD